MNHVVAGAAAEDRRSAAGAQGVVAIAAEHDQRQRDVVRDGEEIVAAIQIDDNHGQAGQWDGYKRVADKKTSVDLDARGIDLVDRDMVVRSGADDKKHAIDYG